MHRTQIYLTDQQVEKIKQEAKEKEIRFSEMLRRIIDTYYEEKNNTK